MDFLNKLRSSLLIEHKPSPSRPANKFLEPYHNNEDSSLASVMGVDDVILDEDERPESFSKKLVHAIKRGNEDLEEVGEEVEDWVVMPEHVTQSHDNEYLGLDKLTHVNERVRMKGCAEIKYDLSLYY
jgi:hypothetical protein